MCRRDQLLGVAMVAFGVGLLAAALFESGIFCTCVAVGAIAVGIGLLQKK